MNAELTAACEALRVYAQGSPRAALQPLDQALAHATQDETLRAELEPVLLQALTDNPHRAGRDYVCATLALLGSTSAVRALAALLGDPESHDAARGALEVIPGRAATQALRKSLAKLSGTPKLGVLGALGRRRDAGSVRSLSRLLESPDLAEQQATAAALGEIGTPEAGRALAKALSSATASLRPTLTDACLVCADRLRAAGRARDADALHRQATPQRRPRSHP